MCLRIDTNTKELVAKNDIVVWKTLDPGNISNFYAFKYKRNTLYRLRQKLEVCGSCIFEGFHSYKSRDGLYGWNKIVKMIIPKGAKYYYGIHSDNRYGYVSSSIRTGDLRDQKGSQ